jgi:hypothetical protein
MVIKKGSKIFTLLYKNLGISTEKSKKRVKKDVLYSYISLQIQEGKYPSEIARTLKTSKQCLNYYIQQLKKEGILIKEQQQKWQISKRVKKTSLGTRKSKNFVLSTTEKGKTPTEDLIATNLHALQIKFPILEGTIKDQDWQVKEKLNNWLPKYKHFDTLGGLLIKNNNNKSLTVWADPRDIKDKSLKEVDNLAFMIRAYLYDYFRFKHNVQLDVFNCEVKNLDLATEDKNAETMQKKGEKFKLDFNKQAEKIFPKDNLASSAWIDGSPFNFTAETNDKDWKREYLKMPFVARDTAIAVNYIAQNYASHVKIVEKVNLMFEKILEKLNKI